MNRDIRVQVLDRTRISSGYSRLRPDNYESVLEAYPAGDTNTAASFIRDAYNPPHVRPITKWYDGPKYSLPNSIVLLERDAESIKPIAKSVAAVAFSEYGNWNVGYVDMLAAVDSDRSAEQTASDIGRLATSVTENAVNLVVVAADFDPTAEQSIRAETVHGQLTGLPIESFRVALLHTPEYAEALQLGVESA